MHGKLDKCFLGLLCLCEGNWWYKWFKENVCQGCVKLPWLFNGFVDGALCDMRTRFGDCGVLLN